MSLISNAHSSFTPTCWACRRSVLMILRPGRWVFLRCESTVKRLSTCFRLGLRTRLTREISVREISIISAWWWTDRTFRGLLIISQTTELVFVKARFHDGARVAERPRFIFSTPTGMKSRSVAIKPVPCALNSRPPRLHVFAFLKFDLYDPPSFHIDNGEPVAIVLHSFSGAGDALQLCQNKTRQGVIIR